MVNFLIDHMHLLLIGGRYNCEPGTEYLAADPVDVPGLDELISTCTQGRSTDVVFDQPIEGDHREELFAMLSSELRSMIIKQLERQDVGNLRLASWSFRQLPQSYFQHLVKTEMPWVWEVEHLVPKDVDWYSLWCKLAAADGGAHWDEKEREWIRERRRAVYDDARAELEQLGTGREDPSYDRLFQECVARSQKAANKDIKAARRSGIWPPRKGTELKGLRNRRRIYGDIEEILGRIATIDRWREEE